MQYRRIGMIILFWAFSAIVAGAAGPEIALDASEHDFGDVQVGDVVETQFRVINKGAAPLVIDEVRTSCGCTKAVSQTKEVPPGKEAAIKVSYDSTGLSPGRKTQSVLIHSNDGKNSVSKFQVFATVIHPISIEPTNLIAKLTRFQEHISFPVTARNNSSQPITLDLSKVEGQIPKAVFKPEKVVVQPNSERPFEIEMNLGKPGKADVLNGTLSIGTDHPKVSLLQLRCFVKFGREK